MLYKNPLVYLASWKYCLPTPDLVTSINGHLEWYTEWDISSKCRHISLYSITKSHLLLSPPIPSERPFNTAKLSRSPWQTQDFQISNFVLKAWTSSLWASTIFLALTDSLRSFLRKCLTSTQVWIATVFLLMVLSSKNDVPPPPKTSS